MAQVIQIKRTTGEVGNKKLHKGELAYSSHDDKLYIGRPDDSANGNILGEDPPVVIGGEAYTEMLAPSIPNIDSAGGNQAASLVLGDAGMTMVDATGVKTTDNYNEVSIKAPADIGTSYSVVMPTNIGTSDQVLSIASITDVDANLGWIDVTSTIEGADDSIISGATAGQILVYQSDMDGVMQTKTIHDTNVGDTYITEANAIVGGWFLDIANETLVGVDTTDNDDIVYLTTSPPATPGWINKTLTGEVTIGNDGATSITGTGSQTVKDFIEAADSLVLLGDLTVKGDTTHVNSNVVAIQDKSLALGIQGGMSSGNTIVSAVDSAEVSVTVPTAITDEIAVDNYIYVGENTNGIPAGSYKVKTSENGTITFDVPELATTEILLAAAKTISVSAKPVTDELATGAGIIIPGGEKGSKSILFNNSDDSFVSNQSLDIVSDVAEPTEESDPDSTQTLSVDGVQIVEVTQTWDDSDDPDNSGNPIGVVETITIGSATTAWDGIEISAVKGGTGLASVDRGDVLISPADDEWKALNGLGTATQKNLAIIASNGTVDGDQILLSDAIGAGLFTADGEVITSGTTDDGTVNAVTYTNPELDAPALLSEIAEGTYPTKPTGALLTLNHDHSFQWSTHIDGGMWSS